MTIARRWWIPAGLAVLAGLLVLRREPLGLDRWSLDLILDHRTTATTPIALAVAFLGSGMLLYPLLLLLAALLPDRRAAALLSVAALAAAQLLHDILLAGVALPRPDPSLFLTPAAGAATASGHAMTAVVGWGLVLRLLRQPLWAAFAAGALVGLARAYLAVHWLSDAVAGLLLGTVILLATVRLLDRPLPAIPWPRLDRRWLLPALAALIALLPIVFTRGSERMKDLLVYAGSAAAAGSGTDVYAYRTPFGMPFTYPPFAAVLVEPLSRIPLGLLQILWALGTVALLIPLARVALAPVVARIGLPITLTLLLISAPIRSHLRFGQVGILLVLLVSLDLLRTTTTRWTGWGVGLATAVKLTPAVFIPWMFITRGLLLPRLADHRLGRRRDPPGTPPAVAQLPGVPARRRLGQQPLRRQRHTRQPIRPRRPSALRAIPASRLLDVARRINSARRRGDLQRATARTRRPPARSCRRTGRAVGGRLTHQLGAPPRVARPADRRAGRSRTGPLGGGVVRPPGHRAAEPRHAR